VGRIVNVQESATNVLYKIYDNTADPFEVRKWIDSDVSDMCMPYMVCLSIHLSVCSSKTVVFRTLQLILTNGRNAEKVL
jgi:hypothetical protein